MERNFENTEFEHVSKWMLEKGYSFDFFSDRQLQHVKMNGNGLVTGNNNYKAILLPANKLITEQSFQQLIALAKQGAKVLVYKNLPEDVPGLEQLEKRRNVFQQLVKQLSFVQSGNLKKAAIGKGVFIISDDLKALFLEGKVINESLAEKGLSSLHRKNPDGFTWFINNRTEKPINEWIELKEKAASVVLFNPMTGKSGLSKWRSNSRGYIEVYLQLESFESIIVQSFYTKKTGAAYPYAEANDQKQELTGKWDIEFLEGGPVLPPKQSGLSLQPWTSGSFSEAKRSGLRRMMPARPCPSSRSSITNRWCPTPWM
jgi:hypothetical protein